MKYPIKTLQIILVPLLSLFLFSCGGGSSDDSSNDNTESSSSSFSSMCGSIVDTKLVSDVDIDSLEKVQIEVISADRVFITRIDEQRNSTQQLVKILGITSEGLSFKAQSDAIDYLSSVTGGTNYLLIANNPAQEYQDSNGARGIYGQLYNSGGENLAEKLLENGFALPEVNGLFSDQLSSCYNSLEDTDDGSPRFSSTCGAVVSNNLLSSISRSEFELVDVTAVSSDFFVLDIKEGLDEGRQLGVKLHGVTSNGVSSFLIEQGLAKITELLSDGGYFLRTSNSCFYTISTGDQATLGQIHSLDGINLTEELIKIGAVVVEANGCSANQLISCYQEIAVDAPAEPTPDHGGEEDTGSYPDTEIDDFLWKPVSESDGRLVILLNVQGVRVRVIGNSTEDLVDRGPSNGRGTTARASGSGCSYGRNIKVKFFDSSGNPILLKDGRTTVDISNGCDRVEFRL